MSCLNSWLVQNSFKSIPQKDRGDGDPHCSWLRLFPPDQCLPLALGILRPPGLVTLTVADQMERRCVQPIRGLMALQGLNAAVEMKKSEVMKAKAKVKDKLEYAMTNFKVMYKERDFPRSKIFESQW
ncbi:hypothetical protein PIB30_025901 [Stylosanthes scabra]|uniref:Uncharacterized protein n=1 Tax=Stylosanthes scabra TaxID=79078 RepID=A0ABU6Y8U9_9FABA|nr:hypothetical protein [Stylosanthes scabra]